MNNNTLSNQPDRDGIQIVAKGIAPEKRNILATVPSHTLTEQDRANEPSPELYRQALKVILGTPEIESRLNYITATMIVSIFGSWLATKAIKSRTAAVIADLLLLFLLTVTIGLLIGILVGEEVLPIATLSALLLATIAAMLFLLGILVREMSQRQTWDNQKPSNTSARRIALPARTSRSISRGRRIG